MVVVIVVELVVVVVAMVVVVLAVLTVYWLTRWTQEVQNESEFYRNKATRESNAVGIVTRLRAGQPRNCVSILGRGKRFFFSRNAQTICGPTQPFIQRRLFPREYSGGIVKLILHLHVVNTMYGPVSPLPLRLYDVHVVYIGTSLHRYTWTDYTVLKWLTGCNKESCKNNRKCKHVSPWIAIKNAMCWFSESGYITKL